MKHDTKKSLMVVGTVGIVVGAGILISKYTKASELPPPVEGLANLYGTVRDNEGSLGNVIVVLRQLETDFQLTTYTNSSGWFEFLDIEPNEYYTVTFELGGYETLSVPKNIVAGNNPLDVTLTKIVEPGENIDIAAYWNLVCSTYTGGVCVAYFPDERQAVVEVTNHNATFSGRVGLRVELIHVGEVSGTMVNYSWDGTFITNEKWVRAYTYVIPTSGLVLSSLYTVTLTDSTGTIIKTVTKSLSL